MAKVKDGPEKGPEKFYKEIEKEEEKRKDQARYRNLLLFGQCAIKQNSLVSDEGLSK